MNQSSSQVTLDKYVYLMSELYKIGANVLNDVIIF